MTDSGTINQLDQGKLATGVAGLDYVLAGGLPENRLYLVQGSPGVGKTTLGLQYLLEGVRQGEPVLYITRSETKEELTAVADSHGWRLEGLTVCEPAAAEEKSKPGEQYTIFHPSEIELSETTQALLNVIDQIKPKRLVIDSLSELRLLARDPLRYRRQILALKHSLSRRQCTVLLLDDQSTDSSNLQLRTLAHGVIHLEQLAPEFGAERRRLRVIKMRGVRFRGGYHDFTIETQGIVIYPRLVAADFRDDVGGGTLRSGVQELDALLGGGLDRGTSSLFLGAAGTGKSALAALYAAAAARVGEKAAIFAFDEGQKTLFTRAAGLGIDIRPFVASGTLTVQPIDPAEMSPGEFAHRLRNAVCQDHVQTVVIDSLNGYLNAMPEEKFLTIQLHELLSFLSHHGVVTILVASQSGLLGEHLNSPVDISYLADTVVLLRYFESQGTVRKAVSVLKKRSGNHQRYIRELIMSPGSISVGQPLSQFAGILSGDAILSPYPSADHG